LLLSVSSLFRKGPRSHTHLCLMVQALRLVLSSCLCPSGEGLEERTGQESHSTNQTETWLEVAFTAAIRILRDSPFPHAPPFVILAARVPLFQGNSVVSKTMRAKKKTPELGGAAPLFGGSMKTSKVQALEDVPR